MQSSGIENVKWPSMHQNARPWTTNMVTQQDYKINGKEIKFSLQERDLGISIQEDIDCNALNQ